MPSASRAPVRARCSTARISLALGPAQPTTSSTSTATRWRSVPSVAGRPTACTGPALPRQQAADLHVLRGQGPPQPQLRAPQVSPGRCLRLPPLSEPPCRTPLLVGRRVGASTSELELRWARVVGSQYNPYQHAPRADPGRNPLLFRTQVRTGSEPGAADHALLLRCTSRGVRGRSCRWARRGPPAGFA